MSAGLPQRCTGTIARVRGVIAAPSRAGSIECCESTSTKTGRAPVATMAPSVAMKVLGAVITSSRGRTPFDALAKPDLVAPGRKMVSLRSPGSTLDTLYPERQVSVLGAVSPDYYRLSGTSMAAPVVAGTIALMYERNPGLSPAQVKKRLKSTVTPLSFGTSFDRGAGLVNAYGAAASINPDKEYGAARVSDAFAKDMRRFIQGQPFIWRDVTFNGGVDSAGMTWEGVTWENVRWDSVTWENVSWEGFTWEGVTWEGVTWESVTWESTDQQATGAQSGTGASWAPID